MEEYPQETIDYLLEQIDALDVLEWIDYHPESMQRVGDIVTAWDPLSQDHSGRYLTVNLKTKKFESTPPNIPRQSGNIIELYARIRHMSLSEATKELADEFGIMLMQAELAAESRGDLLNEAGEFIAKAEKKEEDRTKHMREADKRLRLLIIENENDLEALRLLFQLRFLENNSLTLVPVTLKLMTLEMEAGNHARAVEVGEKHIALSPNDVMVRMELSAAYAATGRKQEAVEELMHLADFAETANQYDMALQAYRRARDIDQEYMDVYPMILNLLQARGDKAGIITEIDLRVRYLKEQQRYSEAALEVGKKLEINPDDRSVHLQLIDLAVIEGLDDERINECLTHVDSLLEKEDMPRAAEALSLLTAELPDNVVVLEMLITTYKRMDMEELVAELQLRLMDLYRKQDNAPAAYLILEELMASPSPDERMFRAMADMLLEDKAYKEALMALKRLAALQEREGDLADAAKTNREIYETDPEQVDAREKEFDLLLAVGHRDEAQERLSGLVEHLEKSAEADRLVAVLERLLTTDPGDVRTLHLLAGVYQRQGNAEHAREIESQITGALKNAKDPAQAKEVAKELLEKDSENATLIGLLAELQHREGLVDEAGETLEGLVRLLRKQERLTEARAALDKLSQLRPEDMVILGQLSDLCTELGDEKGVVSVAERQMALLKKNKDFKGVMEQGEMVLELQPNNAVAQRDLFDAYRQLHENEKAVKIGRSLLRLYHSQSARTHEQDLLEQLTTLLPEDQELVHRYASVLAAAKEEDRLVELLNKFISLHSKDELDKPVKLLRDLHRQHPKMTDLQRRLVALYEQAGRRDDMIAEMQVLIEAEEGEGRTEEALELYEELLEKAPDSLSTRAGYVELLRSLERNEQAVREYLLLGQQLQKARKLQEASQAFSELSQMAPEDPDVLLAHAALLRDMGQTEEADRKVRDLANLYAKQSKTEKAVVLLNEILEREPSNQEVRREVIRLKRDEGKIEEAVQELQFLAKSLHEEGDYEGAIAARRDAVAMQPDSESLHEELIQQLINAARHEEAQGEQLAVAELYAQHGNTDRAMALVQKVAQAAGETLALRRTRAKIFDEMGDDKRALEEYRKLQEEMDRHPFDTPIPMTRQVQTQAIDDFALEILPEYDFDSFVVGSKNSFACATAKAVAEHPGSARNPLFLYSDVGLGKTHLLHAIANHLVAKRPNIRIVYTSTEYFTSELIDAIQNNRVTQFRNKHRQSDVLLLDDVQFLAGKERSQEEFFHIFNMLYQARRQIVVTSDRPPKDISHLDMRLRSRFGQGVIVDIQSPDVETRVAILRAETQKRELEIPGEVLDYIATMITTNVRELKGALNQLVNQHEIGGDPLTLKTAEMVVEKYFVA